MSDELIVALRRGEAWARRQLYERFWDLPYRKARRIVGNDGDGHDVVAGVMVDFMDRLVHSFRGQSDKAIRAYLVTATISRATRYQARKRQVLAQGDVSAVADTARQPSDPLLRTRLERCLSQLPPRARQVLRLKFGRDLDNTEIANLLGVTRAAISKVLVHEQKGALSRLRRCLGSSEPEVA